MKRPSFQFYPKDWLTDIALRTCSLEARGLWIDLLCLMHEGEPYGHLTLPNGVPIDSKILTNFLPNRDQNVTRSLRKCDQILTELHTKGVLKREEKTGIFYSKRMVEDELLRKVRAESGSKGGNPILVNQHGYPTVPPPSSSSLSSSSSSKRTPPTPQGVDVGFEKLWEVYPRKTNKQKAKAAYQKLKPSPELLKTLLSSVEKQRTSEQWTKDNGIFIPHLATWLNGERWTDELPASDIPLTKPKKPEYEKVFEAHQKGETLVCWSNQVEYPPESVRFLDGMPKSATDEVAIMEQNGSQGMLEVGYLLTKEQWSKRNGN